MRKKEKKNKMKAYDEEEVYEILGLRPFRTFALSRVLTNFSDTNSVDDSILRQTGRSTRLLIKAIVAANMGHDIEIVFHSWQLSKQAHSKTKEYLSKLNISYQETQPYLLYLTENEFNNGRLLFSTVSHLSTTNNSYITFYDNALTLI